MMPDTRADSSSRGEAVARTVLTSAIIMGCGVVTGLTAARSLGPSGRGELSAILVWANTLLYAGTLGIPEAVAYFAAVDRATRARVWTTGQATAMVMGTIVMVGGWWIIPVIHGAHTGSLVDSTRWYLLWFAAPCMGSLCAGAWLQGVGALRAFNISRATVPAVHAIGASILFAAGGASVRQFAGAMLAGVIASWIVAGVQGPGRSALRVGPSWSLARRMAHYGGRVQFGSWANAANVRLDQLLLSILAPPAALGIYVVGVSYATLLVPVPSSATVVMLPDVVEHHHRGEVRACVERWYRRLWWTTLAAGTALVPMAVVVVPLAFGRDFDGAIPVAMLLVPATAILGMNEILSTAFRGTGRPEVSSKAEAVGLIVTVVALFALLPRYGIYGAVVASFLAYGAAHVYLVREAGSILGTTAKGLYVPTRGDMGALRDALVKAGQHVMRRGSAHPIGTPEL